MKKKVILVVGALLVLVLVIFGFNSYQKSLGDDSSKNINIKIQTSENVILNEKFKTNAKTLEELLIELNQNKNIILEYQDSEYGMYITGLGKDELFKENPSEGLYWTFESSNNKVCLENEFCPAASSLEIADGDEFSFNLISYE